MCDAFLGCSNRQILLRREIPLISCNTDTPPKVLPEPCLCLSVVPLSCPTCKARKETRLAAIGVQNLATNRRSKAHGMGLIVGELGAIILSVRLVFPCVVTNAHAYKNHKSIGGIRRVTKLLQRDCNKRSSAGYVTNLVRRSAPYTLSTRPTA